MKNGTNIAPIMLSLDRLELNQITLEYAKQFTEIVLFTFLNEGNPVIDYVKEMTKEQKNKLYSVFKLGGGKDTVCLSQNRILKLLDLEI